MTHPLTNSSATQAGFDGTINLQIGTTIPYHIARGSSLESVLNSKFFMPNTLFRTTEDNRLFYYNREGKLYELTFIEAVCPQENN
jgi:hypothetical protein